MKSISATILLLLYGIALVKPALPLVEYYLKMEVYLKQCRNREKPELHCNGQCILMVKIRALNGETQTPLPPTPVKVDLQDYPIGFMEAGAIQNHVTVTSLPARRGCCLILSNEFLSEIFHPPSTGSESSPYA